MLISSRSLSFYRSNRHAFLFFTLLLSLVLIPLSRSLDVSGVLVHALLAASLFAAVLTLQAGFMRKGTLASLG